MPEKKQESFTVTDRRLFTAEGELRQESSEETPVSTPTPVPAPPEVVESARLIPNPKEEESASEERQPMPPPPSDSEQRAQADAYRKSSKDLDTRVELSGHSAKELEMTFERFMASLYMTAMLQMGLMHQ